MLFRTTLTNFFIILNNMDNHDNYEQREELREKEVYVSSS